MIEPAAWQFDAPASIFGQEVADTFESGLPDRRTTRYSAGAELISAIWMRLPQVSSKTAVVTGPIGVGG